MAVLVQTEVDFELPSPSRPSSISPFYYPLSTQLPIKGSPFPFILSFPRSTYSDLWDGGPGNGEEQKSQAHHLRCPSFFLPARPSHSLDLSRPLYIYPFTLQDGSEWTLSLSRLKDSVEFTPSFFCPPSPSSSLQAIASHGRCS